MSSYTEDHLIEQPAIQLMQHELGWEVVNYYDEWSGGGEGERGRLDDESVAAFGFAGTSFWILNGKGRRQVVLRLDPNSGEARSETLRQRPAARGPVLSV